MSLHLLNLPENSRALISPLGEEGFAFIQAPAMQAILTQKGLRDWDSFAASWDDLGLDTYMADGGRYRRRRYSVFDVAADEIELKPHQPHFQMLDHNPLNGGIERWFEPIAPHIAHHPTLLAVIETCRAAFGPPPAGSLSWHVEVHQFRIEANGSSAGRPTPEGLHRDGVDRVLIMLIAKENITGGMSIIQDGSGHRLATRTLSSPFDAVFLDDTRVLHGVTEIRPECRDKAAFRDVLVVTFKSAGTLRREGPYR
jgi:hypothetical protein